MNSLTEHERIRQAEYEAAQGAAADIGLEDEYLTPRERDERHKMRTNFLYFLKFLKIKPKGDILPDGSKVVTPLVSFGDALNPVQRIIVKTMFDLIRKGVPIHLVILKARQFGVSTLFCAWLFWLMWREMYVSTALCAFRIKTVNELNETINRFYESFPLDARPRLRQARKNGRVAKEELYWDDRKAHLMFVIQSKDSLRGVARDAALCTEVGSYDAPEEFFGGFIPVMPVRKFQTLIMEGSPTDGWWKQTYLGAKRGEAGRKALFFPWWFAEWMYSEKIEYSGKTMRHAQTGQKVIFSRSERIEQENLGRLRKQLFNDDTPISDGQMLWRQIKVEQQGEEWFNQEYPRDDVTCFERVTSSAFRICLPLARKSSQEAFDKYPDAFFGVLQPPTLPIFNGEAPAVIFEQEEKEGWINQEERAGGLMLEPPKAEYTYTVGADVADDVEQNDADDADSPDSCFSTASVYCCDTREQVFTWRGRLDPHDFGDELAKIGYLYNTALVCCERNNMGQTTEDRLTRYLWYPNMYRWPDWSSGGDKLTAKIGWETNVKTKQIIISELRTWVRNGWFVVRDAGLALEMGEYVIHHGKYEAGTPGVFADRIIAAALSLMAVAQTPGGMTLVMGSASTTSTTIDTQIRRSASGAAKTAILAKGGGSKLMAAPPRELPKEFTGMVSQRIEQSPWFDAALR